MKKELFKTIVSDILSDDFFSDYKFIKSESTLFFHNGNDAFSVILDHWRDYEDEACVIRPIYGRHFDVLAKWFEKYSFLPLKMQRLDPQIMQYSFSEEEQEISFKYDFSDYDKKIQLLCSIIKKNTAEIYVKYSKLNNFYNGIVAPIVKEDKELPESGVDWIFVYLTLGYLVDRDNYPTLKKKVLERAEWLLHHHELNVAKYYDRLDEIISYMENNVKL